VPAASPFYEDRVALIGGYNGLFDRLVLCERGGSIVERPSTWQPVLPGGDVLPAGIWMAARGRYVHVLSSNTISASAAVSRLRSALDLSSAPHDGLHVRDRRRLGPLRRFESRQPHRQA
jgi:hypothetical protein